MSTNIEPEPWWYLIDAQGDAGTKGTRAKWVISRERGHVDGVPMQGVVDGENGIDHRFHHGQMTILPKDSRTVYRIGMSNSEIINSKNVRAEPVTGKR